MQLSLHIIVLSVEKKLRDEFLPFLLLESIRLPKFLEERSLDDAYRKAVYVESYYIYSPSP